ncbi:type III pantothenate kinase [Thalassoroseus pseudoceratinae]|uniref:type III pantothenate kinase n=1 Tax=Thalassoroseus pseudoceratinae TaxID=2713176 RepID=UPI00142361D8|nr:type III pantothenate kinase [Thalassoroseus pseudoceratinae]
MSNVLAIDVGNSRIKVGLFKVDADHVLPTCKQAITFSADQPFPWRDMEHWQDWSHDLNLTSVIAATNPTHLANVLNSWPTDRKPPLEVSSPEALPLTIDLLEPNRVGIDRVLNAVAANRVRVPGRPIVIVDSGTATTVDVVTADGVFAGGAILAGFELAARSLHRYTALLPLISIDELHEAEPSPIGKETRGALQSGLYWGQVGAIRELVAQMTRSQKPSVEPNTDMILTGGGAELLRPHFPAAISTPHLALQGLALTCLHDH